MKHITERYGSKVNYLEMRTEDFYILREFLRAEGVDIRIMDEYAGTCTIQIRNDGNPWEARDMEAMG